LPAALANDSDSGEEARRAGGRKRAGAASIVFTPEGQMHHRGRIGILRAALVALLASFLLVFATRAQAAPKPAPSHDPPPPPPPAAEPPHAPDHPPAKADDDEEKMPAHHELVTMHVGVVVVELSKFDLAAGTYNVEAIVTVHCDHEPCKPDLDFANGKIVGKPEKLHDEKLVKMMKVKGELTAIIDLSEYPYDNHELQLVLEDKGDPTQVKLVLDQEHTGIKNDIKLPGWDLSQWEARAADDDIGDGTKISQIHYAIIAHRPALMATFKSVVPVIIMLFVAAFTLLLKPKSAPGRLAAATGGLMSVVMFQVGQVGSLPPIAYLTRLDKFMIATYVIYLANIAFSVAMVRFEEKKYERMSELMYLLAAGSVPGIAIVMWTTVFAKLV
jgi:hypothetical protein